MEVAARRISGRGPYPRPRLLLHTPAARTARPMDAREKQDRTSDQRERDASRAQEMAEQERSRWREEIERVAGMSMDEARRIVLAEAEKDARHEAAMLLG